MQIKLDGKVAIITGAARNIGRAIATNFGRAGATVAVGYQQDAAMAQESVELIKATGGQAIAVKMELRDVESLRAAVNEIEQKVGGVDILVNNAAMRPRTKIADVTPEEWDAVLETNVRGPFFLSQAVIPGMRQRKWGRIVNVSGIDAYWGNPQRPHNVASKNAVIGLARALANECGRWGITVNTLVPGAIETKRQHEEKWYPNLAELWEKRLSRIPQGRIGSVQDLADACTFLVSDQSGYITGQELNVTGGSFPLLRQTEVEYD
jgi:3-oxoacyl-[acyl-carrier protein] reductase